MFLLTRSAICIALVVAALPNRPSAGPAATFDSITSQTGAAATAAVDSFCRRDPARCLGVVASIADAAGLADRRPQRASTPAVARNCALRFARDGAHPVSSDACSTSPTSNRISPISTTGKIATAT